MRKGVNGFALAVIWAFIFLLTGFSWIANWEYAQQFQSLGLSKAANEQVFFLHVTFGQLNPVLASSFAFLNLAYSIIADFFTAKPKSAEEIRAEAERLQAIAAATKEKKAAQTELRAMNDEGTKRWIRGKLEMIHDVFPGNKPAENWPPPQVVTEPKEQGDLAHSESRNEAVALSTDDVKRAEQSEQNTLGDERKSGGKTWERDEQNDLVAALPPDVLPVLKRYPKIRAWLSRGQRTVTIEEIVEAAQQSKRKVINRLHDGTFKRSPRNGQLILISSVIEWLKTVPPPQQNNDMLREQPAIQCVEKAS